MIKRLAQAVPVHKVHHTLRERTGALTEAMSTLEPPQHGWQGIGWRVMKKINDERLSLVAAGVTFYVILALFPALTALVSIFGLLANPVMIGEQLVALSDVLPAPAIGLLRGQLDNLLAAPVSRLSAGFVLSLMVAFWSINNAMKAVIDGMNMAYGEKERRGIVQLNVLSFAFALGAVLMVILYLFAIGVVPLVLAFVGLDEFTGRLISWTRWPVLMAVSAIAVGLITRYGPCRVRPKWRWVTPGGVFVVLVWVVMSILFSMYLANFAHYDKTYGSLGAVIGLMMWVWLSTFILLIGAGINAEVEERRRLRREAKKRAEEAKARRKKP